ncbi:MAG: glutathione S-transferase N-terminal domain-containing protein [Thermomicrobium sp.]|nr:glutathione S-transferase N-terminal domain-containing protein [Thermomicrobium sp.]MCX7624548.1 glutathione S-transferase N-terminal domain-containing protein [Thermomicrobium sp.]MDW7982962.1 Uxx-star family glutaredoxin-like (seleno)protein [Thermomicrobium sp.]
MARLELYGTRWCPHTREVREDLEWRGLDFVEYDVEADAAARDRLLALTGGQRSVPVLVENGRIVKVGWNGRVCTF